MTAGDQGLAPYEAGLPEPGTTVGGYLVQRQVGRGGMAAVFEARHQSLGKRVALKLLLPHHAAKSNVAKRFVREGEAAARLNHPHAVDVTDVGTDARGAPYLVMEFLEGEDLASLLDYSDKLGTERTADILIPVCSAIAAAHDLGIIHRDLKPHNIFLARRRQEIVPKVVDFGISKVEADSMKLTGTEAILGTPHYMSPEQAQGASHVDARSDQFAIGVILYECVTGKRPFDGGSLYSVLAQIIHGAPTPAGKLLPSLQPGFEAIIERALRKEPGARYPDVRALGADLIQFASFRTRLTYGADFGLTTDTHEVARAARPLLEQSGVTSRKSDGIAHAQAETVPEQPLPRQQQEPSVEVPTLPMISKGARLGLLGGAGAGLALLVGLAVHGSGNPSIRKPPAQPVVAALPPSPQAQPVAPPTPVGEYDVQTAIEPAMAILKLDGENIGRGPLQRRFKVDGTEHVLDLSAPGYRPTSLRFRDSAPPAKIALERATAARVRAAQPVVAPAPPEAPASSPVAPSQRYGTNGAPILR